MSAETTRYCRGRARHFFQMRSALQRYRTVGHKEKYWHSGLTDIQCVLAVMLTRTSVIRTRTRTCGSRTRTRTRTSDTIGLKDRART